MTEFNRKSVFERGAQALPSNQKSQIIRRSAFTLIEVLIALVILAVAGVTLLELQLCSMRAADRAARQAQAVRFASRIMAETLAAASNGLDSSQGVGDPDTPGGPFNWSIAVADLSQSEIQGASTIGLHSVTLDVTWADGEDERKVELINYFAEKTGSSQAGVAAPAPKAH